MDSARRSSPIRSPAETTAPACRRPGERVSRSIGPDTEMAASTLPPDPRKSEFLRSFDAAINRISDRRLVERARQQLRHTPIDSPDFDDLAAVANS